VTMRWNFNLIVTALTTGAVLLVAGAAIAGSHPSGAAHPPTTATMGGGVTGPRGGTGGVTGPRGGTNPCANYRGPGCPTPTGGPVSGTNRQTCKPNGEGCLRPK
jgi:hypothetical protein